MPRSANLLPLQRMTDLRRMRISSRKGFWTGNLTTSSNSNILKLNSFCQNS